MNKFFAFFIAYFLIVSSAFCENLNGLKNIFHCEYKNQSVDLYVSKRDGFYIHRKSGKVDFEFPKSGPGSIRNFIFENYPEVGGETIKLSFISGVYKYTVFDTTSNHQGEYKTDAGVIVLKGENTLAKYSCINGLSLIHI